MSNFEYYLKNLKGSNQKFFEVVLPILRKNNIKSQYQIPDFDALMKIGIPFNYSLLLIYNRYQLPDWYRNIFVASDSGKHLNADFFSDLFIRLGFLTLNYNDVYDKSSDYYVKKYSLQPQTAILLESVMMSPETRQLLSQPMVEGDSKMEYATEQDELLPLITEKELYHLVNNYLKKEAGIIGFSKLKSNPTVVLNGTYAHKRLVNVNPFRFLNKQRIEKYGFDIDLLIKVGDFLLENSEAAILDSLKTTLEDYKKTSKLKSLLYADCLIGYHLFGMLDRKFYPLVSQWKGVNSERLIESIEPLTVLENMVWIFFDMVINFSYVIHKGKKSVTFQKNEDSPVANVKLLERNMEKYMKYEPSVSDGFLSNYYNDKKNLATNCLLSTFMEAIVLQEAGVPNNQIFLRLEMNPTAKKNSNDFKRIYSTLESKFPGSTDVTHWSSRYGDHRFRSAYDICTSNELNFGKHKIDVAMALLYPVFELCLRIIIRNTKAIVLKLNESFKTEEEMSVYIITAVVAVLGLEEKLRLILEENLNNDSNFKKYYEGERNFYARYVCSKVDEIFEELKKEKSVEEKSRFGKFLDVVKSSFPFSSYFTGKVTA